MSAFYSRETEPDEGGSGYCSDCQVWIEHQDRLCDKICSHNFIDTPTPRPTTETWRKWQKLSHEGINWASDKISAGADFAHQKFRAGVEIAHQTARDKYPEYYEQASEYGQKAYEYGNQAYEAGQQAAEYGNKAYNYANDQLEQLGPWPTPQPTSDPWQLQRCEGCHLDRAEMISRCEARQCRLSYPTDSWHKPELQFTNRPTNPPTPEPTQEPTQEPSLPPSQLPTHPPVHAPTPGAFPDFPGNDPYGGKNLRCLDCLRKTGEMVSKEAQGCWVSETVCQDAPEKVITEASKCLQACRNAD